MSSVEPTSEHTAAKADPATTAGDRPTGIGTEYGNPYDPNQQPYSVYRDPKRAAIEAREAEAAENAKKGSGTEVRFDGPTDPQDGTKRLVTEYGSVTVGETIKLPKEQVADLEAAGFSFSKP